MMIDADDSGGGMLLAHADEIKDMDLAKEVAELLQKHYPDHLWAARARSGLVVIKNLRISHSHGYVLHSWKYMPDEWRNRVMQAGGEILERAGMRRGAGTGEVAQHVEGLADKYQPTGMIIR